MRGEYNLETVAILHFNKNNLGTNKRSLTVALQLLALSSYV
jgi:hypothetical protein